MKLLKLTLKNFQGIKEETFDFPGGCSASIYGDNATGKTTVYNGLTWLLFDKASTGARNYTPKTKGLDGDVHNIENSSEAMIQTEDGRILTLRKVYKEVYKKKRGSISEEFSGNTIEYFIDGVPAKEKEFNQMVLDFCGGDADRIKMLTMLDYFPDQITLENRRKILLEVCGDMSDEEIIAADPELADLPTLLTIPGTADQRYSIDEYRKKAGARKTAINKQLTELPGRIDEASRAIPDIDGLSADHIESAIEDQRAAIERLTADKALILTTGSGTVELRKQLEEIGLRKTQSAVEYAKKCAESTRETDQRIADLEDEYRSCIREVENADIDIRRKTAERDRLSELRAQLLDEYRATSTVVWDEAEAVCPTCGQPLPPEDVERKREEFNIRKSEKLEEINTRGKREANRSTIAALENEIASLETSKETAAKRAAELRGKIDVFKSLRPSPVPFERTEKYAELEAETKDITDRINDAGRAAVEATAKIDKEISQARDRLREEQDKMMQITIAENQRRRIAELEKQEKLLAVEFEDIERGLYLCDAFTKAKVRALTDRINGKFTNVRFRLFQEQLNGGVKDDCEVMIPRADGVLVPYAFANNAARINAGLEIIGTLSKHWEIQMPIFIDNAESVTRLIGTGAQTIRLVVSEADKRLRLELNDTYRF